MKHVHVLLFLVTFLINAPAQAQQRLLDRAPNVFSFNGKRYELTEELLASFRKSWIPPFKVKTVLQEADAQWVLDFISISEAAATRPPCKSLVLEGTQRLVAKEDIVEGRSIRAGRFDELWTIAACGIKKRYRVLEEEGTNELLVYQVFDAAF